MNDGMLQQRLFAEHDLTYQKSFDDGVRTESAVKQQRSRKTVTELPEALEALRTDRVPEKLPRQTGFHCDSDHDVINCRFPNIDCGHHNKRGHFERACLARKRKSRSRNESLVLEYSAAVTEQDTESLEPDDSSYKFHMVHIVHMVRKFMVTLRVNAQSLELK